MVITEKEVNTIKKAPENEPFSLKVDFGQRVIEVTKRGKSAILDKKYELDLNEKYRDKFCYLVDEEGVRKITIFSQDTNRFYKLVSTPDWPTIAISSVPMHRLMSPKKDSQNKVDFLQPYGYILDTCMGMGYTAILSSKTANKVITFEKDDNVYTIAEMNPISDRLFSAKNIEIRREDVYEGIKQIEEEYFDCIIHDPPTFKFAGELFSQDFYCLALRVLKRGGKMFHYTPLYKIKQGVDFPSQVKKRLKKAGFKVIGYSEVASGFLCKKP